MMNESLSRREFLVATAATAASTTLYSPGLARGEAFKTKIRKAKIIGPVTENTLAPLKEAGFDGVETTTICDDEKAAHSREVAEKMGMRVHSVLRGWMEFNSDDPKAVENSLEATRASIRAAHAYGADDILLVPCRVGGMPMPEPWEFKIEFDERTGHVTRVAEKDNDKYAEYIKAQNKATDTSKIAVEKLIPLAEELKIVIGLENVWNNLWCQADFYKNFVASFNNKWVMAYYDIGNHVKYSPPQDWIRTLGKLIIRLHMKDFKLNPDGHNGQFVHPRDGSVDWPAVRKALDDVGYDGWCSIEDDGLPLKEFARRFDLIMAGE